MSRQQRILSSTGVYHVMLRGNERKSLFLDNEDRRRFLKTMLSIKEETRFLLFAYCLMDNHIHLLIKEVNESLSVTLKRIGTSYVHYFNQKYNRIGHLFQDRFKSVAVEDDRYLLAVVRYIHQNPVKAAIVTDPYDYPWSSHTAYINMQADPIIDVDFILSVFANDKNESIELFKEFMRMEEKEQFLDLIEETPKEMQNTNQAIAYLEEYTQEKKIDGGYKYLNNYRSELEEAILELRRRSNLSVRQIAELLNVNRGIVQRIKP